MCNLKREHKWTYLQSRETHKQKTYLRLPKGQWGVTDVHRCRHNRQTMGFQQSPGSHTQCLVIIYTRKDLEKCMCVLCHVWLNANPLDCGPPGSSVHGIFQATILEWLLFPIPGVLLDPRIEPHLLHLLNRQADSLWPCHLGNSCMYVCIYNYV